MTRRHDNCTAVDLIGELPKRHLAMNLPDKYKTRSNSCECIETDLEEASC
jgi:hypothetical protein